METNEYKLIIACLVVSVEVKSIGDAQFSLGCLPERHAKGEEKASKPPSFPNTRCHQTSSYTVYEQERVFSPTILLELPFLFFFVEFRCC